MHEMGMRTPIIFSCPGVVPGGVVSDALVSTVDLFPTLLDYAGAPQRSDRPGRSLRPLIQQRGGRGRDRVIGLGVKWLWPQEPPSEVRDPATELEELEIEFEEFASEYEEAAVGPEAPASRRSRKPVATRSYFLRDRDWWYIWHRGGGAEELYDVSGGPGAERDLAAEHPEVLERLREQVRAWEAETRLFLKPRRKRLAEEAAEASR